MPWNISGAPGNLETIKLLLNDVFSVHQLNAFLTFVTEIVNNSSEFLVF